jgi:hypothetical protein
MTITSSAGTISLEVDMYCAKCGRPMTGRYEEPYIEYYARVLSRIHVDPCPYCKEHPDAEYCGIYA